MSTGPVQGTAAVDASAQSAEELDQESAAATKYRTQETKESIWAQAHNDAATSKAKIAQGVKIP